MPRSSLTTRARSSLGPLLLLIALVTWNTALARAQNVYCDASQFDGLTNVWKSEPDQNTRGIPAGELAAERKIMQRVVQMFRSTFVPTGAIGYYEVNYDILPQAVTNKDRYGNTYIFTLSNHKIECRNGKPVALDVSLGNVSVQVNMHFVGEAERGDSYAGFSYLPRGYYQLKDRIALPQATADGIQEFNFVDGTTVWWLTRAGALPFRYVTRREFLTRQIEIVGSRSSPSPGLLAYYRRLLGEATDEIAFIKQAEVLGLTERGYVFTSLEDRANRVYVTVNPDYYDRSVPKSAPQHILIRVKREDVAFLNRTGNGARHLESMEKLREIARTNLPELRAMVKP
ncbi:MAG: hypothetical protein IT184_17905 [Acidobacteria bacterium]|nr:hypothetical protein [Acidobacteriota bacterium]